MKKLFIFGNGNEWCAFSLKRLASKENVYFINDTLPFVKNKKMAKVHFSNKLNHFVDLPFKGIWFSRVKQFIHDNTIENDEIVVIVYDWNFFGCSQQFSRYLRKFFNNIKLVYVFTNIVKGSLAFTRNYVHLLSQWYDLIFAFDPVDASKYGFSYSPLIYDADPEYRGKKFDCKSEMVFYVGQAKDRIEGLISAYEKLRELKIDCDFHIANVEESKKRYEDTITYNKYMTYREAVDHINKSTCLIDVIQGESTGLTIKVCEAVCYHKKLITTNKHLAEYPFYDPRFMLIINSAEDITKEFFENYKTVEYSTEGVYYFSGERFWNQVWKELGEKVQ